MHIGGYKLEDTGDIKVTEIEAGWSFTVYGEGAMLFLLQWDSFQETSNNFRHFLSDFGYNKLFN
jgi:hypothetical protein